MCYTIPNPFQKIPHFKKKERPMAGSMEEIKKIVDDLKTQRDELSVKFHLAKAEARDEWGNLESKWEEVKTKLAAASEEAGKTTESVSTGLGLALDELKKGYERIRKEL
jgi:uncharacterized protein YukE